MLPVTPTPDLPPEVQAEITVLAPAALPILCNPPDCHPDADPIPAELTTDFAVALADLACCVLGSTEVTPEFNAILAAITWMRLPANNRSARTLIGDLSAGY